MVLVVFEVDELWIEGEKLLDCGKVRLVLILVMGNVVGSFGGEEMQQRLAAAVLQHERVLEGNVCCGCVGEDFMLERGQEWTDHVRQCNGQ